MAVENTSSSMLSGASKNCVKAFQGPPGALKSRSGEFLSVGQPASLYALHLEMT
jgi:hypothetical protein